VRNCSQAARLSDPFFADCLFAARGLVAVTEWFGRLRAEAETRIQTRYELLYHTPKLCTKSSFISSQSARIIVAQQFRGCVRSPRVSKGNPRKVIHRRQYSSSPPVFLNQESLQVSPSLTVGLLTHPLNCWDRAEGFVVREADV